MEIIPFDKNFTMQAPELKLDVNKEYDIKMSLPLMDALLQLLFGPSMAQLDLKFADCLERNFTRVLNENPEDAKEFYKWKMEMNYCNCLERQKELSEQLEQVNNPIRERIRKIEEYQEKTRN